MYRLMLVDDEPEIRDGLLEIINWEQEGFQVVGVAENGLEALQVAQNVSPDLVVTDIRMPFLDGLEMARRMRQTLPTVQFVVLSGYDEFEYARQAIQIQIKDYVLKPISSDEFVQVLRRVKSHLDEDFAQRSDVKTLREHFRSSLPILRELLLTSLLNGGILTGEAMNSAARYELSIVSPRYAVALLRLGGAMHDKTEHDLIRDPELMRFAVMNIVEEVLQGQIPCHVFHYNGLIAVLFLLREEENQPFSLLMDVLGTAQQTVIRYLDCMIAIGVSNPCVHLHQLHHAAVQAASALDQSALLENGQVLAIADVEPGSARQLAAEEITLRALSNNIKLGNTGEAEELLHQLMEEARKSKAAFRDYQVYLLEIFLAIIRTGRDLEVEWTDFGEGQGPSLENMLKSRDLMETEAMLRALCRHLTGSIRDTRLESGKLLVREAVDYVSSSFTKSDVTLEKVCRRLHISAAYFSTLFKRETKKTFHQYLTELRMDKAMTLLAGSDLKTADIAVQVGLNDPSYFSYSFKKHFGISPSQARKKPGEERS
jgi:two-component system response regulator YesN